MFWDNVLESFMLLCFAAAWPASIHRSWTSRTRKGKSLFFMLIIVLGYISGIVRVLLRDDGGFMLVPYTFNTTLVLIDIVLYYRNYRIDEGKATLLSAPKRIAGKFSKKTLTGEADTEGKQESKED